MTVTDVIFGLILALGAGIATSFATAFAIVARPAVRDARARLRRAR